MIGRFLVLGALAATDPLLLWVGHLTWGYDAPPGWVYVALWFVALDILVGPAPWKDAR